MGGMTKDFSEYLDHQLSQDPELAALVEEEEFSADIAAKIYDARTRAGISQKQLATSVGTQQSAISRLENAEYGSQSLSMLRKIAAAMGMTVEILFRDKTAKQNSKPYTEISDWFHEIADCPDQHWTTLAVPELPRRFEEDEIRHWSAESEYSRVEQFLIHVE